MLILRQNYGKMIFCVDKHVENPVYKVVMHRDFVSKLTVILSRKLP